MPLSNTETNIEQSSLSGSQTAYITGRPVFLKYYDTGSGKWERQSGSGAPYVTLLPNYLNDSLGAIKVDLVGTETVVISGSSNVVITGSTVPLQVSGSQLRVQLQVYSGSGYVDAGFGEGYSDIPVTFTTPGVVDTNIEGQVQITGSTITLPITGSVDSRQSGSWIISGSFGGIGDAPAGKQTTRINYFYSGSYVTGSVYSGSSERLFGLTYSYDGSGNVTQIVRGV